MSSVLPLPTLKAHVDVFKDEGDQRVLVHTSRPCPVCMERLLGLVMPVPDQPNQQVHVHCAKRLPANRTIPEVLV